MKNNPPGGLKSGYYETILSLLEITGVNIMHIPENYLSPQTCAVMTVAMLPVWGHAIYKVRKEVSREEMPQLGINSALSFVGMMFNLPIPGGTTGHAVGGTLAAITTGPDAACISVSIALLIQALLFGDGGILSFGANCFNMAFLLPYVGFAVYQLLLKAFKGKREVLAAFLAGYVGINVAALAAAIEFGIQPVLFKDVAGLPLYCPYGLNIAIPAMMAGHLTLFGVAEGIYTAVLLAFVRKTSKAGAADEKSAAVMKVERKPLYILLGVLTVFVPLGLLAQGTAWGEWGADEIAEISQNGAVLGFTPAGLANGFSLETIMPDYAIGALPEWLGYILSAVIGIALCMIIFKLLSAAKKKKTDFAAA